MTSQRSKQKRRPMKTNTGNAIKSETAVETSDHRVDALCIGDLAYEGFSGRALAYALTADNQDYMIAQYDYALEVNTKANFQTRGYRQNRRLRGQKNRPLSEEALIDEMIVIPGAAMSAEDVIAALLKMIRAIQEEGLHVGETDKGCLCVERIGEVPRFVAYQSKTAIEKL